MSLDLIRAEIKTKLESIASIGKVQDYIRHAITWEKIEEFYKDNDKINAWFFRVASTPQSKIASGSIALDRQWNFNLFGFYGLKDVEGTGKVFENIVEDVLDEFSDSQDLVAKVRWPDESPPECALIEERLFVGILCHRAQVNLVYDEQVSFQ